MLSSAIVSLARVRVALAYTLAVGVTSTALTAMDPRLSATVIRHASTNLHNLSHGRIGTLLGSAFVVDAGPVYLWLPGLLCLLALAELLWRGTALVIAFLLGHVGATLIVAVGLTAAVEVGWLPVSVARATDVGMSYGAAAVLGSLTAAIPPRWRGVWSGWWLAIGMTEVAIGRDFTDVGHAVALALGMAVSVWFGRPAPWTPWRGTLLAVASVFGFAMLASATIAPALVALCGVGGAVVGRVTLRAARHRISCIGKDSARPADLPDVAGPVPDELAAP